MISVDEAAFKQAMSSFASGVTVITVKTETEVHGMTASAFFSLSLHPPMVAVSVAKNARLHDLMQKADSFSVNILTREQEAVSQHFAGQEPKDLKIQFDESQGGALILGCLAHVVCDVGEGFEGGDHTIYVGRVTYATRADSGEPLVYYSGGYRSIC
jgi:flavin reductase (DIM6/NTAB) family NADH-FMN oxidoreductase RutF